MSRVATCVWRISDPLIAALDERFGDPVDAYVNGSQTWLLENGPGDIVVEWRLHPVPGYERPPTLGTYDVFPVTAAAIVAGDTPSVPVASLWDGLEAFAAYGDEVEPAPLRAACVDALGVEPDACGLVDHEPIGDAWERSSGRLSVVGALLDQLET
ncbi:MAG TPA: hypothetical protein VM143_12535 [Acidimicrobiales bacterium]|nr:hypothetical protein [Acidimicrobiales bacterium]